MLKLPPSVAAVLAHQPNARQNAKGVNSSTPGTRRPIAMSAVESPGPVLSKGQLAEFERDGVLVVKDWIPPETVSSLKACMERMLREFEPPATHTVFSTNEQKRTSDEYFLSSGDKVRYFFEEGAIDGHGALLKPKEIAVNKVGHNLHELVPEFRDVSFDPRVARACRDLGYERPVIPQSMYICKQPGIGGEVKPHQDGSFLYTEPQSVVGFWWPLEDCTLTNGCLWAVPGSHKLGVKRRFHRDAAGTGATFTPPEAEVFDLTGAVPLEIPAGSLVLIHNAVVHYSEANASHRSRHAYSIHVVEAGKGTRYPADNWLQREGGSPFPDLYPELRGT